MSEQDQRIEYFVILAVQTAAGGASIYPQLFVSSQATRREIFEAARSHLPERFKDGVITFFYAEPNRIAGEVPA